MPKLRALFNVVVYRTEAGDTTSFEQGEIADVPADQVDRLLELGAAEKVSAKDAKAAEKDAAPESDEPTTPAGDPVGDGKTDQDA